MLKSCADTDTLVLAKYVRTYGTVMSTILQIYTHVNSKIVPISDCRHLDLGSNLFACPSLDIPIMVHMPHIESGFTITSPLVDHRMPRPLASKTNHLILRPLPKTTEERKSAQTCAARKTNKYTDQDLTGTVVIRFSVDPGIILIYVSIF